MTHVAVTLEHNNDPIDLALPAELPARALGQAIAAKLGLLPPPGRIFSLAVYNDSGLRPIPPNMTPVEAGLLHGMRITLLVVPIEHETIPAAYLEIEGGRRIPLGAQAVIGRGDPQRNVQVEIDLTALLPNPKLVSRRHARIQRQGEQYFLEDLQSNNGTYLNGRELQPGERAVLRDGDVIVLGRDAARLRFFQK